MYHVVMARIMFHISMQKLRNQVPNDLQAVADVAKRTKLMTEIPTMMVPKVDLMTALLVKYNLMIH